MYEWQNIVVDKNDSEIKNIDKLKLSLGIIPENILWLSEKEIDGDFSQLDPKGLEFQIISTDICNYDFPNNMERGYSNKFYRLWSYR